ncbi:MAG: hypothetical protein M1299_08750 [Firmicutes bacterium]|nr:hypothetical protein [Bacillota bacterium]
MGTKLNMDLVERRLSEAVELGAQSLRIVGGAFDKGQGLLRIVRTCPDRGIRISGDVEVRDLMKRPVREAAEYFDELAVNVDPSLLVAEDVDVRGLILNVTTTDQSMDQLIPFTRRMIEVREAKLLKFSANILSMGSPHTYLTFVERLLTLADEYPGQIYALLPWVLTGIDHLKITRSVCNYRGIIGLFLDGAVTACKIGRDKYDPPASLFRLPLMEVLQLDPLVRGIRSLYPQHLTGICAQCIFRDYCGNLCPARAFNMYGDFACSFPDCQILHDAGLFPGECMNVKP